MEMSATDLQVGTGEANKPVYCGGAFEVLEATQAFRRSSAHRHGGIHMSLGDPIDRVCRGGRLRKSCFAPNPKSNASALSTSLKCSASTRDM